jgi:hypothetical protein
LYCLNQAYLKQNISSSFVNGYFNDGIAGLLLPSYTNIIWFLFSPKDREYYFTKLWVIITLMFGAGVFWEFFSPLYCETVTDNWDILAYVTGGIVYWVIIKIGTTHIIPAEFPA